MDSKQWAEERAQRINSTPGDLKGYECKKCQNRGHIAVAKERPPGLWEAVSIQCDCMKVRRSIANLKKSGLEKQVRNCTFDKYECASAWQAEVKQAAMEFSTKPEGWFYLGGQSGAGKTHLCTAICRELLLKGYEVNYFTWRDDGTKLKSLVTTPDYDKEIKRFKQSEVLYIDDLFKSGGRAQPTTADINLAFEIINHRYNNPDAITIISSELSLKEMEKLDQATAGRIEQRASEYYISPANERNYRKTGG